LVVKRFKIGDRIVLRVFISLGFAMVFAVRVEAQFSPVPVNPAEQKPAEVLKEFPTEIKGGEGTRLFDFKFEPAQGDVVASNGPFVIKFSYETDSPGKVFVGAMPLAKGQFCGGYQPATLSAKQGTAEVKLFCGFPPPTAPITTMEQLKASYQMVDTIELQIYGDPKAEKKVRAPIRFLVIPAANFTVQEKFYIDRLLQEVITLRSRVAQLEAKAK
jgi:hypothetical protein